MIIPDFFSRYHEIWHYSGYGTIVHTEYFYELTCEADLDFLSEAYDFSRGSWLPFLIIGWGTNILFAKDYFPWVVVKNSLSGWIYDPDTKILKTSSNESIWYIAEALEREYHHPIWHRFIGLPWSIGGAIYWNAGCFGLETESNFEQATIYDMETGLSTLYGKSDMGFAYRHSVLKNQSRYFIVDATFDLSKKQEKYHSEVDNIYFREYKQPKGYSCGSFWKNPTTITAETLSMPSESWEKVRPPSAGSLIEEVGLKWYRHGGARWSDLHANFLLSDGKSCKPTDLIELVDMTREKVRSDTGYDLIHEVQII
jgi:UDP-N-acetylmuramate dehydrogenase